MVGSVVRNKQTYFPIPFTRLALRACAGAIADTCTPDPPQASGDLSHSTGTSTSTLGLYSPENGPPACTRAREALTPSTRSNARLLYKSLIFGLLYWSSRAATRVTRFAQTPGYYPAPRPSICCNLRTTCATAATATVAHCTANYNECCSSCFGNKSTCMAQHSGVCPPLYCDWCRCAAEEATRHPCGLLQQRQYCTRQQARSAKGRLQQRMEQA